MRSLQQLEIETIKNPELQEQIQKKIDQKTKPVGSLGQLERIALQIGLIQQTDTPKLNWPIMLTVAADHGITQENVSPCPTEITWQQVLNFVDGGGAIGLFSAIYGFELYVIDAGVNYDFPPHPRLINKKVRKGSRNFLHEPAMTLDECDKAIQNGRNVVSIMAGKGCNVMAFGEMGIGNTTPASALLSIYAQKPVEECTGPGSGLTSEGVDHKTEVIKQAIKKLGISPKPEENLARFGGLEIATIAGAMLQAAKQRMLILVDGFITTAAFMAAHAIEPNVKDYAIFSHSSKEKGHTNMIEYLEAEPVLNLELRLGEGTGAALAYPIVQGSVAMLNQMTSFSESKVFNLADEEKQVEGE